MMQTNRDLLYQHVATLARVPRPRESDALEAARLYVTDQLVACGWQVRRDEFSVENEWGGLDFGEILNGVNLIATQTDFRPQAPRLCVGAHLDSRPETPGADDNASAVAALLEIARLLNDFPISQRHLEVELAVFDLEENGMMGGREHAQSCRRNNIELRGMIALEMLGYCDHRPRSQQLPRQLLGKYPDTGNFIAVIGNQNSTDLIATFRQAACRAPGLPVETLQVPENGQLLQASRLSDHSPFWDEGYAALMITDTSFLRNPHYHQPTDTTDTLDFDFLHRVSEGCWLAVQELLQTPSHPPAVR